MPIKKVFSKMVDTVSADSRTKGPMGIVGAAMLKAKSAGPASSGKGPMGSIAEALKGRRLGMKKGGAAKKSSDAMGRAVKRKNADVKGRDMKKGK